MRRRNAFTLVELLVVIGIIALLIGILLPALNRAKESARTVSCLNQTRNMAQAMFLHATDHKGYFQPAGLHWTQNAFGLPATPNGGLYDSSKRKYTYTGDNRLAPLSAAIAAMWKVPVPLDNTGSMVNYMVKPDFRKKFACPSQDNVLGGYTERADDGWSQPDLPGQNPASGEYMSYIFNEELLGVRESNVQRAVGGTRVGNTNRVKRGAEVFLFSDGQPRGAGRGGDWYTVPATGLDSLHATYFDYWRLHQGDYKSFDYNRHRGKINVVFVDCHAATFNLPPVNYQGTGTDQDLSRIGLSKGIYD